MSTLKNHIKSNDIEREYSKFTSIIHRKKFAQFFTPFPIADLMAKGVRMIDEKPRYGAGGAKIAFVHPKSTGGILLEISERQ